jgi:hypothetical protein
MTTDAKPPKVRQTKQLPLREFFERVQNIRYAVISPWKPLPSALPESPLIVLTDEFSALNTIWNLTRFTPNNQYKAQMAGDRDLIVTVLEKGKHVFPEVFESQILQRHVVHQGCVAVPDSETWPLARMYWKLFYENFLAGQPEDREMLKEYVIQRVGGHPFRPRYRWLELHA